MKVLIVDDSTTIRNILRRALAESCAADVSEAANGKDALAEIDRQRFQLVILDVNMPVMDGVQTLEAIRSSPAHRGLPVIMLTGERNETIVRRLVELGITDFLTKPLSKEKIAERLARVVGRVAEPPAPAPSQPGASAVAPGKHLLVVEGDSDFRQFVSRALSPQFTVHEADSGAIALKMCLDPSQDRLALILVGNDIDQPSLETFAAKIRSVTRSSETRVLAMLPKNGAKPDSLRQSFDGILDRTYVQESFLGQFRRLIGGTDTPLHKLLLLGPTLQKDTVAATEQVFGMMLSTEVELCPADSPDAFVWPGHGVHGSIASTVEDAGFKLVLTMRTAIESGQIIVAHMIGVSPFDVHEADILSSVAEIVNIIAGRLRNRLIEISSHAQIGLPSVWVGDTPPAAPASDESVTAVLCFRAPQQQFSFELTLVGSAIDSARPTAPV